MLQRILLRNNAEGPERLPARAPGVVNWVDQPFVAAGVAVEDHAEVVLDVDGDRLLDEAGFSDIRNGIRHNARGERLSLVLAFASGNRISDLLAQIVQSQLRQVGIELRLKAAPARIYFAALSKRNFDSLAFYSWVTSPQSVPRSTLHSKRLKMQPSGSLHLQGAMTMSCVLPSHLNILNNFNSIRSILKSQKLVRLPHNNN